MNAAHLFTRKFTGLDYRVWLSMLVTCLVCLGLAGYKKIKASSTTVKPCATGLLISINGKATDDDAVCYLNQMALFRIDAPKGEKVKWDFGDGSSPADGPIAPHKFSSENVFTVKATINGHCEYRQDVIVKIAPVVTNEIPKIDIIADSTKVFTGSRIRFSCASNIREEAYEWRVLETNQVQTTQTATFAFPAGGIYTVQLMLNNDRSQIRTVSIEVTAVPQALPPNNIPFPAGGGGNPGVPTDLLKPGENPFEPVKKPDASTAGGNAGANGAEQPKPEAAKAIEIAPETFKSMLQGVLDGKKELTDLFPYLDYKESTLVQKQGEEEKIKLSVFCRKNEKRKIESLELQKDNKNAVQVIIVKMKRKGPFGIFGD